MGKTIEEHIEQLKQIPMHDELSVEYLTCIYETIDAAIEIMRKYQKIEKILDDWTKTEELEWKIREVLEDGDN